jgi:hypothetical protein
MKHSFESEALERVDRDKMHRKAEKVIERSRISENDFEELYGEQVSNDLAVVGELEERFNQQRTRESEDTKKISDIFEAEMLELGELNNWFGDNAFTTKTARFDDYINNIDMVLEFRTHKPKMASFLGLAADVTFSSNASEKFQRILSHIDRGELGKVKYFTSDHMAIRGELRKLPEVVIGVSRETIIEVGELWLEGENRKLDNHRIQIMALLQIRQQLEAFAFYASRIGRENLASVFNERLVVIDDILEKKRDLIKETEGELSKDPIHSGIIDYVSRWRKSHSPVIK